MTDLRTVQAALIVRGDNDRKHFDAEALAELAGSIERDGLAQPITVRPVATGLEIVAGERRFRAMTEVLGWTLIPAIVRELDDRAASAIMLAENLSRVDLDPVAEAEAYASRMEALDLTVGAGRRDGRRERARVVTRLPILRLSRRRGPNDSRRDSSLKSRADDGRPRREPSAHRPRRAWPAT